MASVGRGSWTVPEQLRQASRVIHCLQKERGASCAFCAYKRKATSGIAAALAKDTRSALIVASVEGSRVSSDAALWALLRRAPATESLPIRGCLDKIRALVDRIGASSAAEDSETPQQHPQVARVPFHRCLVMFNSLISNVVHVYVVQVLKKQQRLLRLAHRRDAAPSPLATSHLHKQKHVRNHSASALGHINSDRRHHGSHNSLASLWEQHCHHPPRVTPAHFTTNNTNSTLVDSNIANNEKNSEEDAHRRSRAHYTYSYGSPPSPGPAMRHKCNDHSALYARRRGSLGNTLLCGSLEANATTNANIAVASFTSPPSPPPPTTGICFTNNITAMSPLSAVPNMLRRRTCSAGTATTLGHIMPMLPANDPFNAPHPLGSYQPPPRANPLSLPLDGAHIPPTGSAHREVAQRSATESLLSLLLSFVRLKESTGVERAVLSSFMAMGGQDNDDDDTSSAAALSMIFSDLVLEEANQRTFIRRLNRQTRLALEPKTTTPFFFHDENQKSLMALVAQSVRLSPQMERLQDMIRKNFDLKGFQRAMSMEEFWGFITLYIDQLHALELLIIEELECCIIRSNNNNNTRCWGTTSLDAMSLRENGNKKSRRTSLDVSSIESSTDDMEPILNQEKDEELALSSRENIFHDEEELVTEEDAAIDEKDMGFNTRLIYRLLGKVGQKESISRTDALNLLENLSSDQLKSSLLAVLSVEGGNDDVEGENVFFSSNNQIDDIEDDVNDLMKRSSLPTLLPSMMTPPVVSSKEWEIDLYEVEFRKRIGRGMAGTTYLANWCGQAVAVKVAAITDMGLEGWNTEVQSLQKLHHPNIIRLLGSIYNQSPQTYGLVLEYCESGDMAAALSRWTPPNFFWKVSGDIANGMNYLHHRQIMHRDIKPGNVLLTGDVASGNFTAKLSDLGVAIMHQGEEDEEHTAETGTYRWMAPEVIRHESYSFMADVYSFAVVIWQLITREEPFSKVSQIEAAGYVSIEGLRPPLPIHTPTLIANIIETCWSEDPSQRLSVSQIIVELKQAQQCLSPPEKEWLSVAFGHAVYEIPTTTTTTHHHPQPQRQPHHSIIVRSHSISAGQQVVPPNIVPPRGRRKKEKKPNGIRNMFFKTKKYES